MPAIAKTDPTKISTFPYQCCDIHQPRVGDWVLVFDRIGKPSNALAEVVKLHELHCEMVYSDGQRWSAAYENVRVIIPVESIRQS